MICEMTCPFHSIVVSSARRRGGRKGARKANRLEDTLVRLVGDAVPQGEVDGVVLALAMSNVLDVPRSGEELPVLVEGGRHYTVGRVEGLLHPIAVVHINIDVEDSRVVTQELENAEDDVCSERGGSGGGKARRGRERGRVSSGDRERRGRDAPLM
jgi:hypothetical protein